MWFRFCSKFWKYTCQNIICDYLKVEKLELFLFYFICYLIFYSKYVLFVYFFNFLKYKNSCKIYKTQPFINWL